MSANFELPAYGWRPRPDQLTMWRQMVDPEFLLADVVAHRRWGKDEMALQVMAVKSMTRVGSYWYCLPEYEQARKAIWSMVNWRTQRTRIEDAFPPEIVAKRDNDSMMLTLTSGSTVQLVGSDRVDSLVGGGQIGIVISEAALSNPKFDMYVQPILEESHGWKMRISTPRGKNHFYKGYIGSVADIQSGQKGIVAAHIPATRTAVFTPEQLLRIRMKLLRDKGHTMGTAIYDQEYGCSFEAAIVGAVWGQELTDLSLQLRVRPCSHDKRFPVLTSWDIGVADATVILFWQDIGGMYRLIDAYESTDADDEYFVDMIKSGQTVRPGIGLETAVDVLKHRHRKYGYRYAKHHGPHDVQVREWARGVSRKDEAKRLGLDISRTPNTKLKTQISAGAQLIGQMVVNEDSRGAMAALEHFKGYHYPEVNQNGVQSEAPVHDAHSHASSALMTYAINKASELGMGAQVQDEELGGRMNQEKFDPRQYGNAPYGTRDQHRPTPGAPRRGAFG